MVQVFLESNHNGKAPPPNTLPPPSSSYVEGDREADRERWDVYMLQKRLFKYCSFPSADSFIVFFFFPSGCRLRQKITHQLPFLFL